MTSQSEIKPYTVVRCSTVIERSAEAAWAAIGDYGAAGRFLNIACVLEAGTGGLGSIRRIGEAILEVKVGETPRSYTYIQTQGPMARFGYHGCVVVEPRDNTSCDLIYTLLFDPTDMEDGQETNEVERLGKRFQGAAEAMRLHVLETA